MQNLFLHLLFLTGSKTNANLNLNFLLLVYQVPLQCKRLYEGKINVIFRWQQVKTLYLKHKVYVIKIRSCSRNLSTKLTYENNNIVTCKYCSKKRLLLSTVFLCSCPSGFTRHLFGPLTSEKKTVQVHIIEKIV